MNINNGLQRNNFQPNKVQNNPFSNHNNFNSRVQDLTQVFDNKWQANHGNNEKIQKEKDDFNWKMYGIKSEKERKKEAREKNTVDYKVEKLSEQVNFATQSQHNMQMNKYKNNF